MREKIIGQFLIYAQDGKLSRIKDKIASNLLDDIEEFIRSRNGFYLNEIKKGFLIGLILISEDFQEPSLQDDELDYVQEFIADLLNNYNKKYKNQRIIFSYQIEIW